MKIKRGKLGGGRAAVAWDQSPNWGKKAKKGVK